MTYFAQAGRRIPHAPVTAVVCDACAQETIPWEPRGLSGVLQGDRPAPIAWRQAPPWKWAPRYGGNATCRDCGKGGV